VEDVGVWCLTTPALGGIEARVPYVGIRM
jgi:hypothetical protein